MENINLVNVMIKIILKMYFQRVGSRDCPVHRGLGQAGATGDATVPPGRLPGLAPAPRHTHPSPHRGKGHQPSAQGLARGENTPSQGKAALDL